MATTLKSSEKDKATQCAIFLHAIGDEALDTFTFTKTEQDKIAYSKFKSTKQRSKQDLRDLLGMVDYLSQYIRNMSEITAPLRSLLKDDVQWSWHDEHR